MTSAPDEFDRFVHAAERFCQLILEPPHGRERSDFLSQVRGHLADVLAAGFRLPDPEAITDGVGASIPHVEWQAVFLSLRARIGELPAGSDPFVVTDDLADVWRDLQ